MDDVFGIQCLGCISKDAVRGLLRAGLDDAVIHLEAIRPDVVSEHCVVRGIWMIGPVYMWSNTNLNPRVSTAVDQI